MGEVPSSFAASWLVRSHRNSGRAWAAGLTTGFGAVSLGGMMKGIRNFVFSW
jgi:hypothetical protein